MATPYGYRKGPRELIELPLDSTSADIGADCIAITEDGATSQFFKEVDGSGESLMGWSASKVDSPSADGGAKVLVDVSSQSIYEFPPDAGTVTYALVGKTCDIGADGKSINIDASATDDILIVDVDTTSNTCFVRHIGNLGGVA